jgi:hypothetical protein
LLKVLAALGAVWVVVAGVLVYLMDSTAVASGRVRSDSTGVLQSVRTHANAAQAALAALPQFDASGTSPDFTGAKQTADQYESRLAGDRTTVQADEVRLRADRDRLLNQASGVLALPFRPTLDHERSRAEGLLSALQAEDTALQIEADQMHTLSLIFDAEADFATLLIDHVEKQDVAGALALLPGLDGKLRAASQAAAGPNTAPQARKLVEGAGGCGRGRGVRLAGPRLLRADAPPAVSGPVRLGRPGRGLHSDDLVTRPIGRRR